MLIDTMSDNFGASKILNAKNNFSNQKETRFAKTLALSSLSTCCLISGVRHLFVNVISQARRTSAITIWNKVLRNLCF